MSGRWAKPLQGGFQPEKRHSRIMTVLTKNLKKQLTKRFGARVKFDEPMAQHTSWKVGGPADALVFAADVFEVADLIEILSAADTEWFVMGGGTNLLVKDSGIRAVVICLQHGLDHIEITERNDDGVLVEAGAGARLNSLCRYAAMQDLAGMQFAVGIPGSVGGAVLMNAGTGQKSMESVLKEIDVLNSSGNIISLGTDRLNFKYRALSWENSTGRACHGASVVIAARLLLVPAHGKDLEAQYKAILARRGKTQPRGLSAGCVFKNPSSEMPAGRLIQEAGLKGMEIGGARISEIHANFIITGHKAKASDILKLMEAVRQKVRQRFDVVLEPEVKIVGE